MVIFLWKYNSNKKVPAKPMAATALDAAQKERIWRKIKKILQNNIGGRTDE